MKLATLLRRTADRLAPASVPVSSVTCLDLRTSPYVSIGSPHTSLIADNRFESGPGGWTPA